MSQVLTESAPSDWRALDPENTLYIDLVSGRVVIELAPDFTPHHVANVKALAREQYYDGLAADVPVQARTPLEVLRTETTAFQKLIESRRNRREVWFHSTAGRIELANVPLPVRRVESAAR